MYLGGVGEERLAMYLRGLVVKNIAGLKNTGFSRTPQVRRYSMESLQNNCMVLFAKSENRPSLYLCKPTLACYTSKMEGMRLHHFYFGDRNDACDI